MQKLWAVLFGVVLLGCFLITALALLPPWIPGSMYDKWGLPSNIAAEYGQDVDDLFYLILAFTGFFFVLTEVLLVVAMYRFARTEATHRAAYVHGNHKLELAWTIIPAAILLYIAYAQVSTWERIKYQTHFPEPDQVVEVTAHQWEWRIRYSAEENVVTGWRHHLPTPAEERAWGESPHFDDVYFANELFTWKDARIKMLLKTTDIIHSFFLPNLRLKQDALPGKTIPMWFKPNDWNAKFVDKTDTEPAKVVYREDPTTNDKRHWELACAELCGGGHYRMRGRLFVFETQKQYEAWLKDTKEQQNSHVAANSQQPAE